jgi:hypothetical protein
LRFHNRGLKDFSRRQTGAWTTAKKFDDRLPDEVRNGCERPDDLPGDMGLMTQLGKPQGLYCTKHVSDSSCESGVVAGGHEQTHARDPQDDELARP